MAKMTHGCLVRVRQLNAALHDATDEKDSLSDQLRIALDKIVSLQEQSADHRRTVADLTVQLAQSCDARADDLLYATEGKELSGNYADELLSMQDR